MENLPRVEFRPTNPNRQGPARWTRVIVPKKWSPNEGDELVGEYGGKIDCSGQFGPYRKYVVNTEVNCFFVSGTVADNLFQAAGLGIGDYVKIVFMGNKQTRNEHQYKDWELFVERN